MIQIPDQSGIWMLNLRPVVQWSDIQTAFENWTDLSGCRKVRHLLTFQNRTNLSGFGMVKTSLDRLAQNVL